MSLRIASLDPNVPKAAKGQLQYKFGTCADVICRLPYLQQTPDKM